MLKMGKYGSFFDHLVLMTKMLSASGGFRSLAP